MTEILLQNIPNSLFESDPQFQKTIQNFIDENYSVTICDLEGIIKYSNDQLSHMSGYSSQELIGANQQILNSGHHSEEFWKEFWSSIGKGQKWKDTICSRKKDGSIYWADTYVIPIKLEESVREYITLQKDVTENHTNLKELEKTSMYYEQTQKLSKIGYWELFVDSKELYWDKVVKEIHEVPEDFVPKIRDAIKFYDGEAKNIMQAIMYEAFDKGSNWDTQLPFITAKGRKIWIRIIGRVTLNEDGSPKRIYGIFRDESNQRSFQKELFERDLARQEITMKEKFFSKMSHDLRSPLNSLFGLTQLLESKLTEEAQSSILELIKDSQNQLLELVNDIVDLSSKNENKITLEREDFSLSQLLLSLVNSFKRLASRKNTQIQLDCSNTETIIHSDRGKLSKAIATIFKELLKESDGCKMEVNLHPTADNIVINIELQDCNKDHFISQENIAFEIASKIIVMLNGSIQVLTGAHKIEISIPKRLIIEGNNSNMVQDAPSKITKVLIVEDMPTNQMIVKMMLDKLGIDHTLAKNGAEAVEECRKDNFSHILMDIQMPVMDGITATKKIREFNTNVEIIGLSGKAITDFDYKTVGFNDYLMKPIKYSSLEQIIR